MLQNYKILLRICIIMCEIPLKSAKSPKIGKFGQSIDDFYVKIVN